MQDLVYRICDHEEPNLEGWAENQLVRFGFADGPLNKAQEVQKNLDKAKAYLADQHHAGQPPLAVPYNGMISVPAGPSAKLAKEKAKLETKVTAVRDKGMASVREGKSKLLSCRSCGSKLARDHIQSLECPVCTKPLLPPGLATRLSALITELKEVDEAIQASVNAPPRQVKGICYVVGGYIESKLAAD